MSRICQLSGRRTATGNNRSHSMRATRRTFKINIQGKNVDFGGFGMKVKVSTRMFKKLRGFI